MRRKTVEELREAGGETVRYWVIHEYKRIRNDDDEDGVEITVETHCQEEFRRAAGVTRAIEKLQRKILHLEDVAADIQHMKDNGLDVYERGGVVKA